MVFGVEASSGEKVERLIELKVAGETVSLPLFVIRGREDGPTMAITASIHGTEYSGVEAALRLGRTLDPKELKGSLIVLPVVNIPSFKQRTIYVGPYDHKNLNRVFPGNKDGTFSEALAYQVFHEFIAKSDYYIDLHGGDMIEALIPFVVYAPSKNDEVNKASLAMAESYGIEHIVASEMIGSTIYGASQAGIPAILPEAGGQGVWSEETVSIHTAGVKRVLGNLGMIQEKPSSVPVRVFQFLWLRSDHEGLFYPHVSIGEKVSEGQKVGSVCDYFGNELQAAVSPGSGPVLFLVTALSINKGDPLMGIGG